MMISIQPINVVDANVLRYLKENIETIFKGVNIDISNRSITIGNRFFDERRRQYISDAILAYLVQRLSPGYDKRILGIMDADAYSGSLNFVFGEAFINGPVAIVYLARLRPEFYDEPEDRELFLLRALKEAVHELGHTLGLRHCYDRRCVMSFSNTVWDTDYKRPFFCSKCARKIFINYEIRATHF